MMLDYFLFHALLDEMSGEVAGRRIRKVLQPEAMSFALSFGKGSSLILSLKPELAHLRLDSIPEQRESSTFLLLARKHLEGEKITSLAEIHGQKIAVLRAGSHSLAMEIPGMRNHLFLLDENHHVLGSFPALDTTLEDARLIKKGLPYHAPEAPAFHLFQAQEVQIKENWEAIYSGKDKRWWGLNTLHWRILRGHPPNEALRLLLEARAGKNLKPFVVRGVNLEGISLFPPAGGETSYHELQVASLHQALGWFFAEQSRETWLNENRKRFLSTIRALLQKKKKKLAALETERIEAERSEEFKAIGDILLTSASDLRRGTETFVDPLSGKEIKLDPKKTGVENAQAYYKRFKKSRSAALALEREIRKLEREMGALSELETWVMLAEDESHWEWLEKQLEPNAAKASEKKNASSRAAPFLKIRSKEGFTFLVGRNAGENVEVLHQARKEDLWFHAREIPGGHVVIRVEEKPPTENAIRDAAALAAYYSKGRSWDKVEVDYTLRKEVRSTPGSKAHVTYSNSKTITVTPRREA